MPASRRITASFTGGKAIRQEHATGVILSFRPERARIDVDTIENYASLGPELCVPAVSGLGMVVRIMRAARMITPSDPSILLGQPEIVATLLSKAVGTRLSLGLKTRSRIRFTAWTEDGIETVGDVSEVIESDEAYLVLRSAGRAPVQISREAVIRQQTDCERWYEVIEIERAP